MVDFTLHHFDSLDSTNIKAREFPVCSVVTAREQTAGRGRFKREWSSSAGGVYMSIVVGAEIKNVKYLTIMAAVAVQRALEKVCSVVASIKWPNDLILEERKLCGILTEGYFEGDEAKMIIGIGVNTNNAVPAELKDIAISLHDIGVTVDNEKFIKGIVDEFSILLDESLKSGTSGVLSEWRRLSHTLGKKVRIVVQGAEKREVIGIAKGIDDECNLIVEVDGGRIEKIVEGDVFILK